MILIKTNKLSYGEKSLFNDQDFDKLINHVDPDDITEFIITELIGKSWAPECYWQPNSIQDMIYRGELGWAIYSYLTVRGLLLIEDYYYSLDMKNGREKYLKKTTYYNPLEKCLYDPIFEKIKVNFDEVDTNYFKVSKQYLRNKTLEKILC